MNQNPALPRRKWSGVFKVWWQALRLSLHHLTSTRGAGFGLFVVLLMIFIAFTAGIISPYDPNAQDYNALRMGPTWAHPFGTDHVGRDIMSRVFYGSRISLSAGLIAVAIAGIIGVTGGVVGGYFRGWGDAVIMRTCDAIWAFPSLVLALSLVASLGPSLRNVMIAVGVVFTPVFARLARAETLSVREREYIMAAQAVGVSTRRIMGVHVLPNIITTIIVQASLLVSVAIIIEAGLSFLGVGVRPPTPSWGADLRDGARLLRQGWWMSFFSGFAIFITVLAINLFGDGLRKALDPRLRRVRGL